MNSIRWLMLLALVGGALIPIQGAVNSRLRTAFAHPLQATLISFLMGTAATLILCILGRFSWPAIDRVGQLPAWAWTGGLLGVLFVTSTIVVTPRLGSALALALIVAGQIGTSLWLDHVGAFGLARLA